MLNGDNVKKNVYEVEKNIEKILRGDFTGFLTLNVSKEIQNKLRKKDYNIFCPYQDTEKVILYGKKTPKIFLVKILCYENEKLNHPSILGSLFGLNITSEMFGDIILYNGEFYVYFLESIREFIFHNFVMVGNFPIKLEEIELDFLSNFKRDYEINKIIVSSLRIDSVISKLIGCNRDKVKGLISDKLVLINGEILSKPSYFLKEGDIFSVRKIGKFLFLEIDGNTKKGNYVVIIKKYI